MSDFIEILKELHTTYSEELAKLVQANPNLIRPEQTGVMCLKPFVSYLTGPRRKLVAGHIASNLPLVNPSSANIYTGYESEMARTVYHIPAPCDLKILFVSDKPGSILITYLDYTTHKTCALDIPKYIITSDKFGCVLNIRKDLLFTNSKIAKDTILAITSSVGPEGDWRYGVELNTITISTTATIQDGIGITNKARRALTSYGIGRKRIKVDKNKIPLNKHGDNDNYKPIPDIGDVIGEDRIIAVIRTIDPLLTPLLMSPRMLKSENIDTISDVPVYIGQGEYDAEVIDIRVFYQRPDGAPLTPVGMGDQFDYYRLNDAMEAENLIRFHEQHVAGGKSNFDGWYQILLRRAISTLGNYTDSELDAKGLRRYKGSAPLITSGEPIGEYEIEIVYKYRIIPNYGDKITNTDGTKGVITSIIRDEDAHRDSAGNVAHIQLANLSIARRTNVSAAMYPGLNVYCRDLAIELRETIKSDPEGAYLRLVKFYNIVSPKMAVLELNRIMEGTVTWRESLEEAIYKGVSPDPSNPDRTLIPIYYPQDNPRGFLEIIKLLDENKYPRTRSNITYYNKNGDKIVTDSVSTIGSSYMIALDKLASFNFSAVSAPKLQQHGMPAREPPTTRTTYPISQQATRTDGESEIRPRVALTNGMGEEFKKFLLEAGETKLANNPLVTHGPVADLIDRANNPSVMSYISRRILEEDHPLQMAYAIDRDKIPRGGSRALNLIEHIISCSGVELTK